MKTISFLFCVASTIYCEAQNISAKSNEAAFDFSDAKKNYNSSIPKITWQAPENETSFLKEGKLDISVSIESRNELKSVTMSILDKDNNKSLGTSQVKLSDGNKLQAKIERSISLLDGISEIEVVAENVDGLKAISKKTVHVGATALADASKLNRKDYALIFATDQYDNWRALVNPVFDARTIADRLKTSYGFQTELIENPTQAQVLDKLAEYASRKYDQLDQLFILFAGHGFYNEVLKEGFVVTRESLPNDPGGSSYLRHSALRSTINNNPCEHIFLMMDVCFGGTFDENVASRGDDAVYGEPSQSEIITRKLQFKTRKYLTSGGKEYVSDGIAGKHSPFAKQVIDALDSKGGSDGILTINELMTHVERLQTAPQFGKFGSDKQGSEFVFVVR